MASEMDVLELLEERVRRATELIRHLRRDNSELKVQVKDTEEQLRKSQETLATLEAQGRQGDEITRQLQILKEERQEIRGRVTRMLETFATMEEVPSAGHPDN